MTRLVLILTLMVAAASAALVGLPPRPQVLPSPLPLARLYPNRPVVLPSPLPTYNPVPSPTYNAQAGRVIAILRLDSDIAPDSSAYQYAYETENGISAQENGGLVGSGPDVALGATGSFQYTSPEGVPVQISYIADQNGFQPSGNVLPTPPPTPEAILRSLAYNAAHPEQQAPNVPLARNYYK